MAKELQKTGSGLKTHRNKPTKPHPQTKQSISWFYLISDKSVTHLSSPVTNILTRLSEKWDLKHTLNNNSYTDAASPELETSTHKQKSEGSIYPKVQFTQTFETLEVWSICSHILNLLQGKKYAEKQK